MNIIIVKQDKVKIFVYVHCDRKIDTNCSKLGTNCQILLNPAKVILKYRRPHNFSNINFLLNRIHQHGSTNSMVPLLIL